jgi:uncharacterized protein GlcG (DUF336 family)
VSILHVVQRRLRKAFTAINENNTTLHKRASVKTLRTMQLCLQKAFTAIIWGQDDLK